jgi:hypothetical protein
MKGQRHGNPGTFHETVRDEGYGPSHQKITRIRDILSAIRPHPWLKDFPGHIEIFSLAITNTIFIPGPYIAKEKIWTQTIR